ncbi:MAG: hypothetical protein Ct9H300mP2_4930 [Candidatus Neomarinimicrobiota bacterium]|nr:MAG: hypothetical protein Ct9H300mP2_4930 [Candidatus Neomarinimicrobiota bacterium]
MLQNFIGSFQYFIIKGGFGGDDLKVGITAAGGLIYHIPQPKF